MSNTIKKITFGFLCTFAFLQMAKQPAHAQLRAGASYLKVIPGSEQQGIAGALSGTLDHFFAVYANPGATGLLREWQLSTSYTTWIPEIYNATLLYGKGFRLPWNKRSRIALGISYLGIKDFDSSNGRAPLASGGDLLLTASLGQPIRAISDNLSLGGSVKYLHSRLDHFDASTIVFDLGLLFRTRRFKLRKSNRGFFDDGIFSAGISLTQLGRSLEFNMAKTPLPRTLRAGIGLHLGSHDGLQTHLSAEYRNVRDEENYFGVGAEIAWSYFATFRAGYSFEKDNVLCHFAVGASFRFDDVKNLLFDPGRSKAIRLNTVKLQRNDFFTSPYSGTVNYYPIGPEYFDFIAPMHGTTIKTDSVQLQWELSRDPDLFDGTRYWLLVDQDSVKLAETLKSIAGDSKEALFAQLNNATFLYNGTLTNRSFVLRDLHVTMQSQHAGGLPDVQDYFWTVIAFDKDRHYRFINKKHEHISRFRLLLPDLRIRITQSWLDTLSASKGETAYAFARITAENRGAGTARDFAVAIYDLPAEGAELLAGETVDNSAARTEVAAIPVMPPGADSTLTVRFLLRNGYASLHYIRAKIDDGEAVFESLENNNTDNTDLRVGYDLSLHKQANTDTIRAGEPVRYTLKLTNQGPAAAKTFSLTDVLPPGVNLLRFSHEPEISGDTLRWDQNALEITMLLPGDSVKVEYDIRLAPPLPPQKITIEDVSFVVNTAVFIDSLQADAAIARIIPEIRHVLSMAPAAAIEISGHTDPSGGDAINVPLSQRRAGRVRAYLVQRDPIFARLVARGYGSRRPRYPNATPEGRRKNRRVEISLPAQTATIPQFLVNHSFAKSPEDANGANDTASDTVFVQIPPLPPIVYEEIKFEFDFDYDRLPQEALAKLDLAADTLAHILQNDAGAIIEIAGHTDSIGDSLYNENLSLRRATTVIDYLRSKKTTPAGLFARLNAAGYGKRQPVADNRTEEGQRKNRRIEFRLNGRKIEIKKPST